MSSLYRRMPRTNIHPSPWHWEHVVTPAPKQDGHSSQSFSFIALLISPPQVSVEGADFGRSVQIQRIFGPFSCASAHSDIAMLRA